MSQLMNQLNLDEIKQNQPTINVGTVGSVSHGKSTITKQLTGIQTQKYAEEEERGITMKLGYANAKIFRCKSCPKPQCYQSHSSAANNPPCNICSGPTELIKHISVVDCPGHVFLMETMLNGTCVMDTTIMVESAGTSNTSDIPARQTREHMVATKITGLDTSFVCFNKLDLVKKSKLQPRLEKLTEYLKSVDLPDVPIVPTAANHGINIDVVCQYICEKMEEPVRDLESDVKMIVIRSFNINGPNVRIDKLQGGVIGGTVIKGCLKVGDEVTIVPGIVFREESGSKTRWRHRRITSKVQSINSEKNSLDVATPGGLIGVKLGVDPGLTKEDGLIGNLLITNNHDSLSNYKVFETIYVFLDLFGSKKDELQKDSVVSLNCNACNVDAKVDRVKGSKAQMSLITKPICVQIDDYITISKKEDGHISLLGRCKVVEGEESTLME